MYAHKTAKAVDVLSRITMQDGKYGLTDKYPVSYKRAGFLFYPYNPDMKKDGEFKK